MTLQSNFAPESRSAPLSYTTDDIAPADRFAFFREVVGRVYLHIDLEPPVEGSLHATIESHRWGPAALYFSNIATALRGSRTRELVQDGNGDFRLLFARGAGYRYTSKETDEVVADGSAAMLFNGAVSTVHHLGACNALAVRVPPADLAVAVRNLEEKPLRRAQAGSPALRLLRDYVEVLRRQGPTDDPILASRTAAHLTDLVALAIGATRDACEIAKARGVRAARLAAVKAHIEANLSNPALCAETIGAWHGITGRYVRMLFESEGQSLSGFLLERRLARARDLLRDPRFLDRTVGSIAFDAGFGDLSYFNRAFRRRFGGTPSDVREQTRRES